MKKAAVIFMLVLLSSSLSAGSYQKLFYKDSPEWKAASALAISAGKNPPTSVSPMTGASIVAALNSVNDNSLSEDELIFKQNLLDAVYWEPKFLTKPLAFDAGVLVAPYMFAQTNALERITDPVFFRRDIESIIEFDLELDLASCGYIYGDYLIAAKHLQVPHNKTFIYNFDFGSSIQQEAIFRAGIVLGNDWFNYMISRDGQSHGYGKTGNLLLGDNFTRQHYMRGHIFSKYFDYTLNITMYEPTSGGDNQESLSVQNFRFDGDKQYLMLHRFDFRPFDWASFSLTEGGMLYLANGGFDWRLLNPFLVFHGFDNRSESVIIGNGDEANNIFGLELGITLAPHFRFSIQGVLDQFQDKDEIDRYNEILCPNAFGIIANIESAWILGNTYLSAWIEGAYTSPYLYLNDKKNASGERNHNYDFIVGMWENHGEQEIGYSGYKYGGDAIVAAMGFDYGQPGLFDISGAMEYMIHGPNGLGYLNIILPRGPEYVNKPTPSDGWDSVERSFRIKVTGEYSPADYLTLRLGLGYVNFQNYRLQGRSLDSVMVMLGAALNLTELVF